MCLWMFDNIMSDKNPPHIFVEGFLLNPNISVKNGGNHEKTRGKGTGIYPDF